jgi:uncharacterized protein YjdB/endonuclease I
LWKLIATPAMPHFRQEMDFPVVGKTVMKHSLKTLIVGSLMSFGLALGVGAGIVSRTAQQADALNTTTWTYTTTPNTSAINSYWSTVDTTQYGEDFRASLQTIMNSNSTGSPSYSANNTILTHSDLNPDGSGTLLGFYDGATLTATWDSGDTWNKEHTWPNSRGAGENTGGPGADPHVLRAAAPATNGSRSNKMYGLPSENSSTYDPGSTLAKYRGEAARCIFYAATRYYNTCGTGGSSTGTNPLELTDDPTEVQTNHTMGMVSKLLEWNNAYPVQPEEIVRNECIYNYDGIRNPFIDHPEYANYIWTTDSSVGGTATTHYQRTSAYNVATVDPTSVTVSPSTASVTVGGTVQLTATVSPSNASPKTVTWTTSNSSYATVSTSGLVTGVAAGTVTITATSTSNPSLSSNCTVTVTAAPNVTYQLVTATSQLAANDIVIIGKGRNASVTSSSIYFLSNNATSSSTSIPGVTNSVASDFATVSSSSTTALLKLTTSSTHYTLNLQNLGSLTGTQMLHAVSGTSTTLNFDTSTSYNKWDITIDSSSYVASIKSSSKSTYHVYSGTGDTFTCAKTTANVYLYKQVVSVPVTSVSLNYSSLTLSVGNTATLVATIVPGNATNQSVTWASSNTSVATVDANGVVTAHAAGSATITVTTVDGSHTATCTITVPAPVTVTSLTTAGEAAPAPFRTPGWVVSEHLGTLAVTAHYSNGSTADVTADAVYTSPDNTVLGLQHPAVSYTDDYGNTVSSTYAIRVTNVGAVHYSASQSEGTFTLVTSLSELVEGTHVVIARHITTGTATYVIGSTQNSNNRAAVAATTSTDFSTLTPDTGVAFATLTVGVTTASSGDAAYTFHDGGTTAPGYLYAANTSTGGDNYLRTSSSITEASKWAITVASDGTATVASFGDVNGRNLLKFNYTNTIFSAYSSSSGSVNDVSIYKAGSSQVENFTYAQQSAATTAYIASFKTCPSGWLDRTEIPHLAIEFSAMLDDSKTLFMASTNTVNDYNYGVGTGYDYNQTTKSYTGGSTKGITVTAYQKLYAILAQYNGSLVSGETTLTLYTTTQGTTTTGGDTSPRLLDAAGHIINPTSAQNTLSTTLIVVASSGVFTLLMVAGIFLLSKKKKHA